MNRAALCASKEQSHTLLISTGQILLLKILKLQIYVRGQSMLKVWVKVSILDIAAVYLQYAMVGMSIIHV